LKAATPAAQYIGVEKLPEKSTVLVEDNT